MTDARSLLERHNPRLVIFPQDRDRPRPGARRAEGGWGDFHPCSVEFFLDRVHQRRRTPNYDYRGLLLLTRWRSGLWQPLRADGIDALRDKMAAAAPEETASWELDVAEIPSQDEQRAWEAYLRYVYGSPADGEPYRCVTYARLADGTSERSLQYWYLYMYNDFMNNHEADWEMVTISLDEDDQPIEVGYSNHHGGIRCDWADAPRDGDRPLLYVARGSHAGYLGYRRGGHPLAGELSKGSVPRAFAFLLPVRGAINWVIRAAQRVPGVRLMRDFPPADPDRDADAPSGHQGTRVDPEVIVLPRVEEATPDSDFWWLRYRGRWGSTRPRLTGSVGIAGPWVGSALDSRWSDPVRWLRNCVVGETSTET